MCVRIFISMYALRTNLQPISIVWKLNLNVFKCKIRPSSPKKATWQGLVILALPYVCKYVCMYVHTYVCMSYHHLIYPDHLKIKRRCVYM